MKTFSVGRTDKGKLEIDLLRMIDTRVLVNANSGGGKSWLLRLIAERTGSRVQTIILDPEGEFATLREKLDIALVGREGEIPADPRAAGLLARKLMELKISAVVDLYDLKLPERRAFVRLFIESLLSIPKALYHPVIIALDEAHKFCMDAETEILTAQGWATWEQVNRQTMAVCFDPKDGRYHNEIVQDVIVRHHDGEMVSLRSDGVDCLITPDHRVVLARIQRAQGRYEIYPWTFCQADEVPNHVYLPIGGAPVGPGVSGLSEDMARLLGLVITDGCFTGGSRRRYLAITQSDATKKMGREIADEIEVLFIRLGGKTVYHRPERLRRGAQTTTSRDFYLGLDLSKKILCWLDRDIHRIPRQILTQGSPAQLAALYDGLCMGDGTGNPKWGWTNFFPGHNEGLADDFQELATRLGISTSKRHVEFKSQTWQWVINITRRTRHYVRKPTGSYYAGLVWDITVPSGAFVARRHGRVFVTGNCPERGSGEAESTGAVIDLASQGRKRGLCSILLTQRLSKLHKDAAAELNNVFVGRCWQDVDRDRAGDLLGMTKADRLVLRDLAPGEFFAFGPALTKSGVVRFHSDVVMTTHPKPGERHKLEVPRASEAIREIVQQIGDLPAQAADETRTIEAARRRIDELERALRARPVQVRPKVEQVIQHIEVPIFKDGEVNKLGAIAQSMAEASRLMAEAAPQLLTASQQIVRAIQVATAQQSRMRVAPPSARAPIAVPVPRRMPAPVTSPGAPLQKAERRILIVLAQYPHGKSLKDIAVIAGYRWNGGGFNNAISRCKVNSWISGSKERYILTDMGLAAIGEWEPLPTGPGLIDYWMRQLPKAERAALQVLIDQYPHAIYKDALAEAAGYTPGTGGINNAISRLRTLELAEGRNQLKASDTLFAE